MFLVHEKIVDLKVTHVLVIAPLYPGESVSRGQDGIATYFENMVCGYRDLGVKVDVMTSALPMRTIEIGRFGEVVHGVGTQRDKARSLSPWLRVLQLEASLALKSSRVRERQVFDLVEVPDWMTPAIAPAIAQIGGRSFMKLHGPADYIRRLNGHEPTGLQRISDFRTRWWARRADVLHAGAQILVDFAQQSWGLDRPIPVTPDPWLSENTYPNSAVTIPFNADTIELVSIGRLEWRKGQHVLMESLNRLPIDAWDLPWRVTLIGHDTSTGPHGTSYKAYLQELASSELAARIRWIDPVPIGLLSEVHRHADVTVVCSLDGNYGYTTIQALADGACLVSTHEPGFHESPYIRSGENAMLVAPGQADELTQALTHLLLNPEARRKLRENAQEVCKLVAPRLVATRVLNDANVS